MKTTFATVVALASLAAAVPVHAANPHDMHAGAGSQHRAGTAMPMSEGTVRKVDQVAGRITLAHGPLANLDMPAMTMVFRVSDAAMLDQLQVGDRIRFVAEQMAGTLTIVALEAAR